MPSANFEKDFTPEATAQSAAAANLNAAAGSQSTAATVFLERTDPADLPEWMDEPCSYEQFRACVRDLGRLNRLTLAYRPTLHFLERVAAARNGENQPLKVVDVGSGGGDMLRRIARWAAQRKLPVQLTGVDINPHATRAAAELSAQNPLFQSIRWCTGNVYTAPAAQEADVVLSALMTHHMRDEEVVIFLRWMEAHAPHGWFINDLLRSSRASRWFTILAAVLRWHPFVRHDGPVSFRRAFRSEDWYRLLAQAGVPRETVRLTTPVPGRLCVARYR